MAKLERSYNVPLRKEYQKAPKYKRAKKAVTALKQFISKHMKSDDVKVGKYVNEKIWERGIKNPPHHVRVNAIKEDNKVMVELVGAPVEVKKEEGKKEDKKVVGKEEKTDETKETVKEEKKEKVKKEKKKVQETKEEVKSKVKEEKSSESKSK